MAIGLGGCAPTSRSLHQHVDPECLPEELGGKSGPFDNTEAARATKNIPEYFSDIEKYVYHRSSEK